MTSSLMSALNNISNFMPWNATRVPDGVTPVQAFDVSRYDGKWYEIARLDTVFERKLDNVSATYELRDDGGIDVLNRGLKEDSGKVSSINGKAYFVGEPNQGHLKVSFFGPLYASYVVFGLLSGKSDNSTSSSDNTASAEKYQAAFVTGNSKSFLWLLARTPQVSEAVKTDFLQRAEAMGYETEDLKWVDQSQNQALLESASALPHEGVSSAAALMPT